MLPAGAEEAQQGAEDFMMHFNRFGFGCFLLIASGALSGCSASGDEECIIGTEGCLCYGNASCDPGLVCEPNAGICTVAPGSGGQGGTTPGSGGGQAIGGSAGIRDPGGVGGMVASGGATSGAGGFSTAGAGGASPGAGGDLTSGGASGSGGAGFAGAPLEAGSAGAGGQGGSLQGGSAGEAAVGGGTAGAPAPSGGAGGLGGGGGAAGQAGDGSAGNAGAAGGGSISDWIGACLRVGFVGEDRSTASGAEPDQIITWLEALGADVTRIGPNETLTDDLLAPLNVVVVGNMEARTNDGEPYMEPAIDSMTAWVESGGGLLTLAGYTGDEYAVQPTSDLLSLLGLAYEYEGRGAGILGGEQTPNPIPVGDGATHPVLDRVSQVGIYYAYPVSGNGTVLLEHEGTSLAIAHEQVNGRAIAFADEYITLVSEWPNHANLDHEMLWLNMLAWLAEPSGCVPEE